MPGKLRSLNRTDLPAPASEVGASMIRAIDPASGEISEIYGSEGGQQFYTPRAGKHQKLKNGNRLITEAQAGRVFEISPEGNTVWEWVREPFNEDLVAEVLEGTRYEINAHQVAQWSCAGAH